MTTEKPAGTAELVDFSQVHVGDELTFLTSDNGFGGTGHAKKRTGTVTGKTGKSVTLRVPGATTARLRRADWSARNVSRFQS